MDMKSAFYNVVLEEEVYTEQTQGYKVKGKEDRDLKSSKKISIG